jgi:DnaJ-class molecular chaperone
MKQCPACKGYGLVEVLQPNGDREALDCTECDGSGCILETDAEVERARIAGML